MQTECSSEVLEFEGCAGRRVVAAFDGGELTSDAGALLLRRVDRVLDLSGRVAGCFADHRCQDLVEHSVQALVCQRIAGIALGYEDLNDHDELRRDPVLGLLADKLEAKRSEKDIEVQARERLFTARTEFERETREYRLELDAEDRRLAETQAGLAEKADELQAREAGVQELEKSLADRGMHLAQAEAELDAAVAVQKEKLEQIAGLTSEQAKQELLKALENEARMDAAGAKAFLIGESLMRQDDVAAAARALRPGG